jgi:hypothetical protein
MARSMYVKWLKTCTKTENKNLSQNKQNSCNGLLLTFKLFIFSTQRKAVNKYILWMEDVLQEVSFGKVEGHSLPNVYTKWRSYIV